MLGALASAILIAAARLGAGSAPSSHGSAPVSPSPQAIADSGLQSPAQIAQGFAALDPASRSDFAALLDAIDSAPSSGTFTSLTDEQRQLFIPQSLAPLAPPPVSDADLAALNASLDAEDADYDLYAADVESGTLSEEIDPPLATETPDPPEGTPQTFPPPPPPPPSQVLANALLAGLQLVSTAPAPPVAVPPPPPPLAPGVLASLIAALSAGVAPEDLPPSLIDQLTAGLDDSGVEQSAPLPAFVLGDALAVWILGA